jgi:hypothetical protein
MLAHSITDTARQLQMKPRELMAFLAEAGMLRGLLKCAVIMVRCHFPSDAVAAGGRNVIVGLSGMLSGDGKRVMALLFTLEEWKNLNDSLARVPGMTMRDWEMKFAEDVTREEKTAAI